jgi:hypothetical protein
MTDHSKFALGDLICWHGPGQVRSMSSLKHDTYHKIPIASRLDGKLCCDIREAIDLNTLKDISLSDLRRGHDMYHKIRTDC